MPKIIDFKFKKPLLELTTTMSSINFYKNTLLLFMTALVSISVHAGEITSLEWNIIGSLQVTYAVGKSGQMIEVHCTAFSEDKKPIGGGFAFTQGGVALVYVQVPSKYQNTDKVRVTCRP
jgi:hypothetical protein